MRNNLPPDSQPWVRNIENRLDQIERRFRNLETLVRVNNSRLSIILEQQNQLLGMRNDVSAAINYLDDFILVNRTINSSKKVLENVKQASGVVFLEYDPQYDAHITATTGSNGEVIVQVSGVMNVTATQSSISAWYYLEIINSEGNVTVVTEPSRIAQATYYPAIDDTVTDESIGAGPDFKLILSPNQEYTFRVRRAYQVLPALENNTATIEWTQNSIRIIRLGARNPGYMVE